MTAPIGGGKGSYRVALYSTVQLFGLELITVISGRSSTNLIMISYGIVRVSIPRSRRKNANANANLPPVCT